MIEYQEIKISNLLQYEVKYQITTWKKQRKLNMDHVNDIYLYITLGYDTSTYIMPEIHLWNRKNKLIIFDGQHRWHAFRKIAIDLIDGTIPNRLKNLTFRIAIHNNTIERDIWTKFRAINKCIAMPAIYFGRSGIQNINDMLQKMMENEFVITTYWKSSKMTGVKGLTHINIDIFRKYIDEIDWNDMYKQFPFFDADDIFNQIIRINRLIPHIIRSENINQMLDDYKLRCRITSKTIDKTGAFILNQLQNNVSSKENYSLGIIPRFGWLQLLGRCDELDVYIEEDLVDIDISDDEKDELEKEMGC